MCAVEVATRGARGAPGPDRAPGKRRQAARTRDDRPPRRRGTVHTTIAYNGITIFSINATFRTRRTRTHTEPVRRTTVN